VFNQISTKTSEAPYAHKEIIDPVQYVREEFKVPVFPREWRRESNLWPIARDTPTYDNSNDKWKVVRCGGRQTNNNHRQSFISDIPIQNKYQVLHNLTVPPCDKLSSCITERQGNLFNGPSTVSLVHCVASDLRMGAGIARDFKYRYGNLSYLKAQNKKEGQIITLPMNNNYIFISLQKTYLVINQK
jgi:hypothetical protein